MNYSELKDLAKASKTKVTDLLALAPQNDPFYVGTASSMEQGQWFAILWLRSYKLPAALIAWLDELEQAKQLSLF